MNANNTERTPTQHVYDLLEKAQDFFNKELFQSMLPKTVITLQRQKNTLGYFSTNRWVNKDGTLAHEIALNPSYFATRSLMDMLSTIVHEQCHQWQDKYGTPGRGNYHNKEWANKMESVGLIPSATGKPNGKKTGDRMSHYPDPHGQFIAACRTFIKKGEELRWVDRFPLNANRALNDMTTETEGGLQEENTMLYTPMSDMMTGVIEPHRHNGQHRKKPKTKIKYTCPSCKSNVWGKPDIKLGCLDCSVAYLENKR